jgi:membrane-associated phospholipid phosphatase
VLQSKQYNHFKLAAAVSLVFAMISALFAFLNGKNASFILLHNHYNSVLDYFFWTVTFLGNGFALIPIILVCFLLRKDFLLPLVMGILICIIVTQFLKQVVYPGELRPVGLELQHITVRRVLGLELNKTSSFPSGHTSQAFTLALLLVCLFKGRVWCFILPTIAFLVGYSRVYLAQHYVMDVCAGILVGILSAFLALQLYKAILRRRAETN